MRNTLCQLSYAKNSSHLRLVSVLLGFFLLSCNAWSLQPYSPQVCTGDIPVGVDINTLDEACKELSAKMGYGTFIEEAPTFTFTDGDPWQCNEMSGLHISVKACFIWDYILSDSGRIIEPGIYINGKSTNQKCLIKHEFGHFLLKQHGLAPTRDSFGGSHHRIMKDIGYTGYICHIE